MGFAGSKPGFGRLCSALLALFALPAAAQTADHAAAARMMDGMIAQSYAYRDTLPGGELPRSARLDAMRDAVSDDRSLLRYAEDRLLSLADHHAITGRSFKDSWAVVPTYADLWIVYRDGHFHIDSVRADSPAERAGVKPGDRLVAVDGVDARAAVSAFWGALGLAETPRRVDHAARILAAGRRDRVRHLGIAGAGSDGGADGVVRQLALPSLYGAEVSLPPVTATAAGGRSIIRFNNSLGDMATIAAFDSAMQGVDAGADLVIDLRDTPSGGNSVVARAILGWFVDRPRAYQIHNRPAEARETGIARQWIEQVLPREGRYRKRLPIIWVGRWTGSMGEGLAVGFDALGAEVRGTRMAELRGSVEDLRVGGTDLTIKLPTERLMTVDGQPREDFEPRALD